MAKAIDTNPIRRWLLVLIAAPVAVAMTVSGCNADVCQHHGGLKHAYVISGTWYYQCNDGVTV